MKPHPVTLICNTRNAGSLNVLFTRIGVRLNSEALEVLIASHCLGLSPRHHLPHLPLDPIVPERPRDQSLPHSDPHAQPIVAAWVTMSLHSSYSSSCATD